MIQNKELRTFSKKFARDLAQSIKAEGMYNPIVVRPNPEKPGRFLLVAGRSRLYAKKKVLKERFIECNVLHDMDEEDHKMAAITENLWRSEISKAQRLLSVQRWHEHYVAKHNPKPKSEPAAATTNEQKTTEETSANLAEHGNGLVAESNGEPSDEKALTAAKVEANFVRSLPPRPGSPSGRLIARPGSLSYSPRTTWRSSRRRPSPSSKSKRSPRSRTRPNERR